MPVAERPASAPQFGDDKNKGVKLGYTSLYISKADSGTAAGGTDRPCCRQTEQRLENQLSLTKKKQNN
jgi:hypothetical protein